MNQSAPRPMIEGTLASVSTLLMTVGARNKPDDGREGRLEPGRAAAAFDRFEQGGLLAADVGPGAEVDDDLEAEPGAEDVPAEEARAFGLGHRLAEPAGDALVLAPDIDDGRADADGEGGDDHALEEPVRIADQDGPVLERARLAFVGVDAQILRARRPPGGRKTT